MSLIGGEVYHVGDLPGCLCGLMPCLKADCLLLRFGFMKCGICYLQHLLPPEARASHIGTCGIYKFCGFNWMFCFEPVFRCLGVYSVHNPCCYLGCINHCGRIIPCLPPKITRISQGFTKYALENGLLDNERDIAEARKVVETVAPAQQTMNGLMKTNIELQKSVRAHDEQLSAMREQMRSLEKQVQGQLRPAPGGHRGTIGAYQVNGAPMATQNPMMIDVELEDPKEPAIMIDIEQRGPDSL